MYVKHPVFERPENRNVKIWRYQDISKLIATLSSSSLFFTRADLFEDKYEGSLPQANIEIRQTGFRSIEESSGQIADWYRHLTGEQISFEQANILAKQSALHVQNYRIRENLAYRRFTCINCWHMNESESTAMWKLYCQSQEAVVIQSTFSNLIESLGICPQEIYVGMVKYTDYEMEAIPTGNDFYRFIYKRHSFKHEQELRAIYQEHPPIKEKLDGTQEIDWDAVLFEGGINIKVDLNSLIERIVVAPTAPLWFIDVVKSVVEKYGFSFPVESSSLLRPPQF